MKILHIVEATTAGVGRHVFDLATCMAQAGLDVTVACPRVREHSRRDTVFVSRIKAAGVPFIEIPLRRGIHPVSDLQNFFALTQAIKRHDFNVAHSHSSKAGALGRLSARRCGVPISVYTPNAFAFLGAQGRFNRWLYLTIERWLGQTMTDALICVSQAEMQLADEQAIAPSHRLVLVENAIDPLPFAVNIDPQTAKTALGLEPDQPVVGYVGRLAPQKGIDSLLQAAQAVIAQEPDTQFVLVGEGELEGEIRQMIVEHRLDERLVLTGYRTDVPQVLAALDIFVLPSLYEGLPYTLMEAMAAGRAVIATDVMGNRDLIQNGEAGLLVPPADARALADALLRLLSAPDEREQLGRMARSVARSRPTPEQMARQVTQLYASILDRKMPEPKRECEQL